MSLRELGFASPRNKYGLVVLAIRRGRDVTLNPDSDDRLRSGDWLVLAGRDELLDRLDGLTRSGAPGRRQHLSWSPR